MPDFYDEVNMLVNDIIEQRATVIDVFGRIRTLKAKYGEDIFPGIYFEREAKPWNKAYLLRLKEKNITGACSEEFILHMAEVSEYIALRKKRIFATVAAIAAVAVIIGLFLLGAHKRPETHNTSANDRMLYEDIGTVEEVCWDGSQCLMVEDSEYDGRLIHNGYFDDF